MKAPQLLTPAQTADRLGVSRPTVYDIVAAGHLDVVAVGTGSRPGIRIPEDSLAKYIAARRVPARSPSPLRPAV